LREVTHFYLQDLRDDGDWAIPLPGLRPARS
jgi:hypothetical protein